MERDTNQMPQTNLCRSGCGFYGNPATDGLCSKCYKDALKKKQSTPSMAGRTSPVTSTSDSSNQQATSKAESEVISTVTTASPTVSSLPSSSSNNQSEKSDSENISGDNSTACSSSQSEISADKPDNMDTECSADGSDLSQKDQKKKKSRCFTCRKKVGLTGFECRCGGLFCSLHRYSDKHECKFDYKQLGAQEIRKNNPLIVGKKIQKI